MLASRLSEDGDSTVTVLEAGGWAVDPLIHIPAGVYSVFKNPRLVIEYSGVNKTYLPVQTRIRVFRCLRTPPTHSQIPSRMGVGVKPVDLRIAA